MFVRLKNQIIARLDKIFPGLDSKSDNNKPLYFAPFKNKLFWIIVNEKLIPSRVRKMNEEKLQRVFLENEYHISRVKAKRIKAYFEKLMVIEDASFKRDLEFLSGDLNFLNIISEKLKEKEERMIKLMLQTPARVISGQIPGISDLQLATYTGLVGDIKNYENAGKIFSKAGLSPKVSQSGMTSKRGLGIKRAGNRLLRKALYNMALTTLLSNPYFNAYYKKLKERNKLGKKAIIAVARKLNRALFAMIRKQEGYNPQ